MIEDKHSSLRMKYRKKGSQIVETMTITASANAIWLTEATIRCGCDYGPVFEGNYKPAAALNRRQQ